MSTQHPLPDKILRPPAPAGTQIPAEWKKIEGSRETWQLTAAPQASYPLYYFVPSHTADGRYLIYHSERSGWVQLYRMDLETGESVQLTMGTTRECGWEVWSEVRLRGIRNHLSALNLRTNEVFYFDWDELRSVHLVTLEDRGVCRLPGRLSVGQTDFSPDGRQFVFIHSDHDMFKRTTGDLRALRNMNVPLDQEEWRQAIPSTIAVVDVATGACRDVLECPIYVHHALFIDDRTLLLNHVGTDKIGMWTLDLETGETAHLRPRDEHGAVCHQVVAQGTIFYETQVTLPDFGNGVRLGRYEIASNRYEEFPITKGEFAHVGRDPEGRWVFFESAQQARFGDRHYLAVVKHAMDDKRRTIETLREFPSAEAYRRFFQRGHAHPFLDPGRRWLYFTEIIEGTPQICRMNVSDLAENPDYCWPAEWTASRVGRPVRKIW